MFKSESKSNRAEQANQTKSQQKKPTYVGSVGQSQSAIK